MNYVIVDSRGNFNSDIANRLAICDDIELNIVAYCTNIADANAHIGNGVANAVVVADNIIEQPGFFVPGLPTYAYQTKPDSAGVIAQAQLPNIGIIKSAKEIIEVLVNLNAQAQNPQPVQQPQYNSAYTAPQYQQPVYTQPQGGAPAPAPSYTAPAQQYAVPQPNPAQTTAPYTAPAQQYAAPQSASAQTTASYTAPTQQYAPPQTTPTQATAPQPAVQQYAAPQPTPQTMQRREEAEYSDENDDLAPIEIKEKAKVVTIYSAKGGVGKTTLASEIAAYLSLTCKKRGKLRVCIVDYNIDFGDVMTTLGFAPDGINMCVWADEINERIAKGESVEYSAREIEQNFLQKKCFTEDTELFALLAPPNHLDSMSLTEDALTVMLKNLINNGEFDFVICDTGNNTRDSSIIALDNADFIFLVVTQDITTINCNDSFLTTMREMEFDESRVRVVINNITSAKETSISISDIESFVSFPCIAHIKRNSDVIKANNQSIPLVFKSNHEFTKELRNIVTFLINDGEVVAEEKKRFSLFGSKNKGKKDKK